MAEEKLMRMSQVARKLNVGTSTIADHLARKGFEIENKPNAKITQEQYQILLKEFESSVMDKQEASDLKIGNKKENVAINTEESEKEKTEDSQEEEVQIKNVGAQKEEAEKTEEKEEETPQGEPDQAQEEEEKEEDEHKLKGIKVVGKIDLGEEKKEKEKKKETKTSKKTQKTEEKTSPEISPEKEEEQQSPEAISQEKEETAKAEDKEEAAAEQEATSEQESTEEAQTQEPESQEEVSESKEQEAAEKAEKEDKEKEEGQSSEKISVQGDAETLKGLKVVGKIDLPQKEKSEPVASSDESGKKESEQSKKKKRKRFKVKSTKKEEKDKSQEASKESSKKQKPASKDKGGKKKKKQDNKEEVSEQEIQDQIRSTLSRLEGGGKSRSKIRKEKRSAMAEKEEEKKQQEAEDANKLKVTEFISANELANLMNVSVNEVISTSMSLGMFVSINQRLDAESITIIADEYGYDVEFVSEEEEYDLPVEEEEEDDPSKLQERAPIVTVMGHVDHGKTTLLDYIKKTDIATGEAGGITQHVGAYDVETENGKRITFLDTPGHEAFTAMRARGAKLTDVAIIVVAADDTVMPQTKEAINHAQVAGVPIIIAINKVDKPGANPDKVREELAEMNVLVEDWGGKYQCEEISAKGGQNISELLEKVILEAEVLELKANPDKPASGTVIEASLDKGRGYVTNILVQDGTLNVSDVILAGPYEGRVRAMMDYKGNTLQEAGPSKPVQILGLSGAPQAGDKFNVMKSEREAREIANKRQQILREQSLRAQKHITLDEIGRRLAIGNFKELNIIVKGDVDGSIEAIADALLKLSREEVQVNIIHKGVGQISESDVLLASASDAIIIGFQVRPSSGARKVAEREGIEIRLHSVIYDAINEVKEAMEGMLSPKIEEVVTGHAEVRDVFKVSKVGTVAGCYVTDGIIKRNNNVRVIRDGIVIYTGELDSLKRYKDDINEVKSGYECGISIKKFNDIKVGDEIEGFEEQETKQKLE